MTLFGIRFEEVLLLQNKKKIVRVSNWGTPSDEGTLTLEGKQCRSR